MGSCFSAEQMTNNRIDRELSTYNDNQSNRRKILLLGTGESGKSTLFKQMKILHQGGFNQEESLSYTKIVVMNILESVQDIIKGIEFKQMQYGNKVNSQLAEQVLAIDILDPQAYDWVIVSVNNLLLMLNDPAFEEAKRRTYEFFHLDSAFYWYDHRQRILGNLKQYVPSADDILRTRVTTLGIVTTEFHQKDIIFEMYDVGGQRGQRKKWLHCFDNVDAVLFVTSLTEYDHVLREEASTNRMQESFDLWDRLIQLPYFRNTLFILFLNKDDIFREKIQVTDLGDYFPEYRGGKKYDNALKWIHNQFKDRALQHGLQVIVHVTTATNTENFRVIWNLVRKSIVVKHLQNTGLIAENDNLM